MTMKAKIFAALIFFHAVTATLFGREVGATSNEPTRIDKSRQLILVITKGWEAVPGSLWRFERADEHSPWKQVGGKIRIVVGRNGLAWGSGLNEPTKLPGP